MTVDGTCSTRITFPLPPLTPLVSFHYVFEEVRGEGKRNEGEDQRLTPSSRPQSPSAFSILWKGIIKGRLNASWKICYLVVNRQSFLVIDGYLLNILCLLELICIRIEF